jgi:hypothetical protein
VCVGTRGVVLCKSCEVEIRILSLYIIQEEQRIEIYGGRRDIYTRVPAIS